MWASEIRERRPSREELTALVDATCKGYVPDDQRELLIKGLRVFVRFAEWLALGFDPLEGRR
jgi:hypothetical protein